MSAPGRGHVFAPELYSEQCWQRSTSWSYVPNIKDPGLLVSDKNIFKSFLYISLKHVSPRALPVWLQGNNLNNLGRGPLVEAKYQISKAWSFCFQTRRFLKFFHFWPQGYNLNTFGLGDWWGGGGGGGGGNRGNFDTGVRASISKPTPFIYLAFE